MSGVHMRTEKSIRNIVYGEVNVILTVLLKMCIRDRNNWVNSGDGRYRLKEDGTRYENQWFSTTSNPALPSSKPVTNWYYAGADGKMCIRDSPDTFWALV